MPLYLRQMTQKNLYIKVTKNIGAGEFAKEQINNQYDFIPLIKRGLYKKNLLKLAKEMSLPLKDFAGFLPVSERTIRRYKSSQRLSPNVTEHLIKIAELYTKGLDVFENKEKFLHWLDTDNKILSSKPIQLLDTITGINLIIDELGRIEHGVYI
jgi:putative toxin-antitoxin system antitoxin component (TIGR02293 family)